MALTHAPINQYTPVRSHGESEWNKENRFTGWYDVQLSEKGACVTFVQCRC